MNTIQPIDEFVKGTVKRARAAQLATLFAEIGTASKVELGMLYSRHIGYNPYDVPGDELDDLEDVRMTLEDFIREAAASEGIHWSQIIGGTA